MLYILSAANTIGIIRSTVSITFIINLDEMFYNACVSNTIKKSISNTAYEIKHTRLWFDIPAARPLVAYAHRHRVLATPSPPHARMLCIQRGQAWYVNEFHLRVPGLLPNRPISNHKGVSPPPLLSRRAICQAI